MRRNLIWRWPALGKWPTRSALLALLLASFLAFTAHSVVGASAASGRHVLRGHLVPRLAHQHAKGNTESSTALDLSIALTLRNRGELDTLLREQDDPHSPRYHQYLTPEQFTQRFSPTSAEVAKVTAYLREQGLLVRSVSPNNTLINAAGSVAVVQRAFSVQIQDFALDGRTVHAPMNEPSVPDTLGSLITNIGGLDNVGVYHPLGLQRVATPSTPLAAGLSDHNSPGALREAYDMGPLVNTYMGLGMTGTGQTVALFELDGYNPHDINNYLGNFNLGPAKYADVLVDGATNTTGSGSGEVELDMEIVSAIAPGATQKIYIGPNSVQGVNDTYNRIVTDNLAQVTSISWGQCEANLGTAELQTLDTIFAQGAAQGQAFFAAAGDAGAYDCRGSTNLGVDTPADNPHVVGVGGTTLLVDTGNVYSSETAWSDPTNTTFGPKGVGGGGGLSSYFAKPSYQSGPGTGSFPSFRHVPDVSADADPASGYDVFCTVSAAGCPPTESGDSWINVGGTSAAAPLWAGIATDINQYLAANGKPTLGSASATLYLLFNTPTPLRYPAYHDITSGTNLYYSATAGYDLASGIGTPDVWNLARDAVEAAGMFTPLAVSGDFITNTSDAVGKSDLALAGVLHTLPVAASKGDGTFSVTADATVGDFGGWAEVPGVGVVTGNFDGDAKGTTDIALLPGPNTPWWYTLPVAFSNGDGTFRITNTAVGDFTKSWAQAPGVKVVTGDFDGDGTTDIALVGGPGWTTVPVAFSKGDGTFTITNGYVGDFAGWAQASGVHVVAGNFDGDRKGTTDIALSGGSPWASVPVALSNGDGTFRIVNATTVGDFAGWAATPGVHVVTGNFDHDSKGTTDIALLPGPNTPWWYTLPVAFSNGDGTFRITNTAGLGYFTSAWAQAPGVKVVSGDFNGDGKTDIALTGVNGWNSIPVATSQGDGTFGVTADTGVGYFAIWAATPGVQVVSGDFNGDGTTDLALTGGSGWNSIPVAFSKGDGTFTITNAPAPDFAFLAEPHPPATPGGVPATVPNVVSMSQTSATAALTASQLVVGTVSQDNRCIDVAGTVLVQSPAAGTLADVGTAINLTVSSGLDSTGHTCVLK